MINIPTKKHNPIVISQDNLHEHCPSEYTLQDYLHQEPIPPDLPLSDRGNFIHFESDDEIFTIIPRQYRNLLQEVLEKWTPTKIKIRKKFHTKLLSCLKQKLWNFYQTAKYPGYLLKRLVIHISYLIIPCRIAKKK